MFYVLISICMIAQSEINYYYYFILIFIVVFSGPQQGHNAGGKQWQDNASSDHLLPRVTFLQGARPTRAE